MLVQLLALSSTLTTRKFGVSYIRFRKHYLHIPYLVLAVLEFGLLFCVFFLLQTLVSIADVGYTHVQSSLVSAFWFALVLSCGTLAMGGYLVMVYESLSLLFFRTLVA